MKTGIVISVFDKIEELEVSINLSILAKFDEILVVCENDAPIDRILQLKLNYSFELKIVESTKFIYSSKKFEFYKSITPRVWEAQRKGLLELAPKVDFIMHTHSDGWVLDSSTPIKLIEEMNERSCNIAYRGVGLTYQNLIGSPTGTIDDHFYIVRSEAVTNSLFLKKPLIDYMPGLFNIHGILSTWIISEVGLSKSYHYDDTREWLNWDGSTRNYKKGNPLRAYVLNAKRGLLHCHADDFPGDTGKALQVRDLNRYIKSDHSIALESFIKKYELSDVDIKLGREYQIIRKKLNFFLDFDEDYKNLAVMKLKLQQYRENAFKALLSNLVKQIGKKLKRAFKISFKETLFPKTLIEVYASSNITFKNIDENKVLEQIIKKPPR